MVRVSYVIAVLSLIWIGERSPTLGESMAWRSMGGESGSRIVFLYRKRHDREDCYMGN